MRRQDGLSKRCGCTPRLWTKCTHPWHFAFCHGKDVAGRRVRHRVSLHRVADRPVGDVMARTEAEALADRIRTDVRAGTCAPLAVGMLPAAEPTLETSRIATCATTRVGTHASRTRCVALAAEGGGA